MSSSEASSEKVFEAKIYALSKANKLSHRSSQRIQSLKMSIYGKSTSRH
jgi:hypothetical protein